MPRTTRLACGRLACTFAALSMLSGCCPPAPPPPGVYYGPTDPMWKVVDEINRNSGKIPSLWSQQMSYTATLVDRERQSSQSVSGDGRMIFRRPMTLLIKGDEAIVGPIFQLGSNDDEFWVRVYPGDSVEWWGHYRNLGKACCGSIPIRPDLVMEVLGLSIFDSNLLNEPAPIMRFNNEADAYTFLWSVRAPDRRVAQKEIWYDRASKLPVRVLLFDDDGRCLLQARLSKHIRVETPGAPPESWPRAAGHYELFFPDEGTRMSFDFAALATQPTKGRLPAQVSRPAEDTKRSTQIDRECDLASEASMPH